MKILFQSRKTLFSAPGGDTIQILKTQEYLKKIGVEVDLSLELTPDVSKYDLIHVFNLMRPQELYLQIRNAKKYKKKIALSTIYGPYEECEKKMRTGILYHLNQYLSITQIEYLKVIARACLNFEFNKGTLCYLLNGHKRLQKKIVSCVDVFLPNSDSEMIRVAHDFDLKNYRYRSIPNSIDSHLFKNDVKISSDFEQYRGCVLCVARIEIRKNQLNVIRALKNSPYKLVFVGKPGRNAHKYFAACRREANSNTVFLGQMEQNKIAQLYALAKVHILASWMETPGLSSLEAGAMNTNLVITRKGDTEDYFKNLVYYCEPDDLSSIRTAVETAMNAPIRLELASHIRQNFTWEKTAEETLKAYQSIISQN